MATKTKSVKTQPANTKKPTASAKRGATKRENAEEAANKAGLALGRLVRRRWSDGDAEDNVDTACAIMALRGYLDGLGLSAEGAALLLADSGVAVCAISGDPRIMDSAFAKVRRMRREGGAASKAKSSAKRRGASSRA